MKRNQRAKEEKELTSNMWIARMLGLLAGMDDHLGKAEAAMLDVYARCVAVVEANANARLLKDDQIDRIKDLMEAAGSKFDNQFAARALVVDLSEYIRDNAKNLH